MAEKVNITFQPAKKKFRKVNFCRGLEIGKSVQLFNNHFEIVVVGSLLMSHVQQKDARWRLLLQIIICIPIGI
jgi:hypothetical protein